jgi:4-amino-4-deoxy-L-arabinose transferase-like glycosyltransferase
LTLANEARLITFLKEHCALFGVLLGSVLVSISLGPYSNWDSETEFAAASSVVKLGLPYATPGNLINQPPIGFYIDAVFLRAFGLSYTTGVSVITLFGVGCVFVLYKLGKTFYGERTGLLAAGIFALTPWHVALSRSFLIDTQCLFFSLLSLLVGIWAIRKASLKLTLASGILFGVALLTKLFAIFTLIPLAVIFAYYGLKNFKRGLSQFALFALPSVFMHYSWYEVISRLGFFSILTHTDFLSFSQGVTPSPFFLIRFFIQNPGLLFLLATIISVSLSLWMREHSTKLAFFDFVCLATIIGTAGMNMLLVLNLGLWVPYVNPVKYDYQLLPAFCLLAASLVPKAYSIVKSAPTHAKQRKPIRAVAVIGLVLLAGSVLLNLRTLLLLTAQDYLMFRVEGDVGFSLTRLAPTIAQQSLAAFQGLGFLLIIVSLLWANRAVFSHGEKKPESSMKPLETRL